ncbi:unnamed protein product [Brugia timori]|uniref:Uncharacterized protein n=1 Tax=Brugia timori TaxID=42155 RepID=A0A3P7W8C4_9BILA|nr:unnamed protein product [Brugia timori]
MEDRFKQTTQPVHDEIKWFPDVDTAEMRDQGEKKKNMEKETKKSEKIRNLKVFKQCSDMIIERYYAKIKTTFRKICKMKLVKTGDPCQIFSIHQGIQLMMSNNGLINV